MKLPISKLYYWMVGPRSRPNYWTCSQFAAWIRKKSNVDPKPKSATGEGWNAWHNANRGKFGYWLAEEGLDILQDIWMFIPDVYHRIKIYLRNRFIDRPHLLDTKLKPGKWYEFDTRLLHGMFEALVVFVEDEKAAMYRWTSDEKFSLPNAEKGIQYLEMEMTLTEDVEESDGAKQALTRQAEQAKETLELYHWWKNKRPQRKEPGEAVGLWDFHEKLREKNGEDAENGIWSVLGRDLPEDDDKEHKRLLEASNQVETDYWNEDTEMMIRLVKLRGGLWT